MATTNLTGQATISSAVRTRINQLKTEMDKRLVIWNRLPNDKKIKWVKSGKDPIMTLSWQIYRYLRDNFFDNGADS